jgi:hypothetical protein
MLLHVGAGARYGRQFSLRLPAHMIPDLAAPYDDPR